ncbi:zinc finger protein 20 isoform X1 [Cricetulus griseus]|uniref:zinc finger protein 20 isoform X1 n=1 Tax=Cricetulus griseus TaxID=10029 RepID=UPI0015C3218E|nr:zinc finger protein 20 isoform X1 [Cricetulus griseus]
MSGSGCPCWNRYLDDCRALGNEPPLFLRSKSLPENTSSCCCFNPGETCSHRNALRKDTLAHQKREREKVAFEDVAVNFNSGEWALLNSFQKKLYRDVMKETFLNLISIEKAVEENIGENCIDFSRNSRIQVIEKDCGYACVHECDKTQEPITENVINTGMPPGERVCQSPLHIRNILGHSSSHGYLREQTTGIPSAWKKAMTKAFTHQEHWKDTHHSESLQVLETSPTEKPCESQQYNEGCRSLSLDQPQERAHPGVTLHENDLTGYTFVQNDEGVHKQVKKLVCKFGEESFIAPNDLNNHEKSYIGQKRYNCRQCGKTFKNAKCFEKHKVTHTKENPYVYKICQETFTCSSHLKKHERVHTGEKPYACKYCGKPFSDSTSHKKHERNHSAENLMHVTIEEKPSGPPVLIRIMQGFTLD